MNWIYTCAEYPSFFEAIQLISVRNHRADFSCLQAEDIMTSGKTIANTIILSLVRRERLVLGTRSMLGCTAVHTHNASVETQVQRMSKVPRIEGPPVQPCFSDMLSRIERGQNVIVAITLEALQEQMPWSQATRSGRIQHCAIRAGIRASDCNAYPTAITIVAENAI